MALKIRKAKPADTKAIVALWHGLLEHHIKLAIKNRKLDDYYLLADDSEKTWTKWLKKLMKSKDGLVLVVQDGKEIVGYSMNHIKKNVPVYKLKKLGYFGDLFVAGPYRNKGVGRRFFLEAKKWFKKKGMRHASIAVHDVNRKARGIYRNWGFFEFHHELRIRL
jgi:GNAT superfamily N-acetyltransferase